MMMMSLAIYRTVVEGLQYGHVSVKDLPTLEKKVRGDLLCWQSQL